MDKLVPFRGLGPRKPWISRFARNDCGSVLIFAVWAIGFLAIFTVIIGRIIAGELMFGNWIKNRILLRGLTNAGIERALFEIQADKFLTFDALNEKWSSNEEAFRNRPLGSGEFSVECGTLPLYGVCDESSRLNINKATEENLNNLLKIVDEKLPENVRTEIAQAMIDWRDQDDQSMTQGAEASYYKRLSNPYEPRNNPFMAPEELLMVRGIDERLFKKMEPFITIYTDGPVNFNTADSIVLQALGLSSQLANKLIEFRQGPDKKEGTKDDLVFQDPGNITASLSVAVSFSSEEYAQIANAISSGSVGVKAGAFRIHSIGRLIKDGKTTNDRKNQSSVTCVVNRKGDVLYWQEGK